MLAFTQKGGKILSGGYLINSNLLNQTMGAPVGVQMGVPVGLQMGVPVGLQIGGKVNNEKLSNKTKVNGVLPDSMFDTFINYVNSGKIRKKKKKRREKKERKKTERLKKKRKNKTIKR